MRVLNLMVATLMAVMLRVSYLDAQASQTTSKASSLQADLGVQAASQPKLIGWLPGDEFEAIRQKTQTQGPMLRKPPKRRA